METSGAAYIEFFNGGTKHLTTTDNHKSILIKNKQKLGQITVIKNVKDVGGSLIGDTHKFKVKLFMKTGPGTWGQIFPERWVWKGHNAVWTGLVKGRDYKIEEVGDSNYTLVSNDGPKNLSCNRNIHLVNRRKPGSIIIEKTGLLGTDGASFAVDGPGSSNDFNFTLTAASPLWSNNSLPWGSYTITETTPTGYDTPIFTVNGVEQSPGNSATVVIGGGAQQSLTYTVIVENKPYGSVEIYKTDAFNGEALGGSIFQLFKEGNSWDLINPPGNVGPLPGTGYYKWDNLEHGNYWLFEFLVPKGYLAKEVFFTIALPPNGVLHHTIIEAIADPRIPGDITLNKTGLGSNDVAGFTLYDSANNPVGLEQTVTGNGQVSWTGLPWDTYRIAETTKPSGFYAIADITGIVIDARVEGQQSYTFDRENTKILYGSITLSKTGLGSKEIAGFTLFDSANNPVGGQQTVTGNGQVSWTSLALNDTYKIVETKVPAGYDKMDDITGIVVNSGQLNHSFDRKNTKTKKKAVEASIEVLAFTGMPLAVPISGFSALIAGALMVLIALRKRLKRKKI